MPKIKVVYDKLLSAINPNPEAHKNRLLIKNVERCETEFEFKGGITNIPMINDFIRMHLTEDELKAYNLIMVVNADNNSIIYNRSDYSF